MMYQKIKRAWSHGYAEYLPRFKEVFPELKNISSEEMADRFIELDIEFYTVEEKTVSIWLRFTYPFALIVMLLMFAWIPLMFFFTGKWSYSLSDKNRLLDWFRALKLQ